MKFKTNLIPLISDFDFFFRTMTNKTIFNIRAELLVAFFFVIATLSVYLQVGDHEFINYDDEVYVTHNPYVREGLTSEK